MGFCAILILSYCSGCVGFLSGTFQEDCIKLKKKVHGIIVSRARNFVADYTFYVGNNRGWPSGFVESIDYPLLGALKPSGDALPGHVKQFDGKLGGRILESLRECKVDDAVYLGTLRNRDSRMAGLAWLGGDGSILAGLAIITSGKVYYVYTDLYHVLDDDASVYDIFWENPPYYLWRNPYWALRLTKDDRELNECIKGIRKSMDSVHTDRYSLSCFCYDNTVLAFRINISPKEFDNAVNEGRCVDLK